MKVKNFILYTGIIANLVFGPMACTSMKTTSSYNIPREVRKVYVKAAADEEYRSIPVIWEKRIKRSFEKTSKAFKDQFGIELVLTGIEKWDSYDRTKSISNTMSELKREVYPGNNDLVVGFTGQVYKMSRNGRDYYGAGLSDGIGHGHYILLTDFADYKDLIHEFGHIFGAHHSSNPKSVMCQGSRYSTTKFLDKRNIDKIIQNKYKNFRQKHEKWRKR